MKPHEIEEEIKKLNSNIATWNNEIDELQIESSCLENRAYEIQCEIDECENEIVKLDDNVEEAEAQISDFERELESFDDPEYRNPKWYQQEESLFDFLELT